MLNTTVEVELGWMPVGVDFMCCVH